VKLLFGMSTLGTAAFVVESTKATIRWNDHEIVSTSPWTGTKHLRWDDVKRVEYSEVNRWFVFSSAETKIRAYYLLGGLAELLREARTRLPEPVYRPALEAFRAQGGLEEKLIEVYDENGRRVGVPESTFERHVLRPKLDEAWNDAEALSGLVARGVDEGFSAQLIAAAARLVALEHDSERSLLLSATVHMKGGDLDAAERRIDQSLSLHGRTGASLTCLARVLAERGEREASLATLREALDHNPNHANALAWWLALAEERGGKATYTAALDEVAARPGAFRPQLHLARHRLQSGQRAEALALYEHVLAFAAHEPSVLLEISGDLGNAGAVEELVRLVAPRYDVDRDGPYPGLNLALAFEQLGRAGDARAMVEKLQQLGFAPLAEPLAALAKALEGRT
jgi:tetratricopeptide (TPR) repeat protein